MSTPSAELRQRGKHGKRSGTSPAPKGATDGDYDIIEKAKQEFRTEAPSEWDYKLAIAVITVIAFITRFYAITHPNQVVFDEVHFGKVCLPPCFSPV